MLSSVTLRTAESDEFGGTVLKYDVQRQVDKVIVGAELQVIVPCYEGHPVRASVDVGAAQGETFGEAVARLARWLRATADALEGNGTMATVPLAWSATMPGDDGVRGREE